MNGATNIMLKNDLTFDDYAYSGPQGTSGLDMKQNAKKSTKDVDETEEARHNIEKEILCVKEVENLLGISHSSLYKLLDRKLIKSFRVGRRRLISRTAINNFIIEQENNYE